MQLHMFGATDKGLVREGNEDGYICDPAKGFMAVSDGMGGHKAGEIASEFVLKMMQEFMSKWNAENTQQPNLIMSQLLSKTNAMLLEKAQSNTEFSGMGATLCCIKFLGNLAVIGHAGDSRVYLLRPNTAQNTSTPWLIWPLTVDHNVGVFHERGLIRPMNLNDHQKSRLLRGMGVGPHLDPDVYLLELQPHDVILACSDGLHGVVSEQEILHVLQTNSVGDIPKALIKSALQRGAPDNVTITMAVLESSKKNDLNFESRNFLVRLPSGRIFGGLTASRLMTIWLKGELPLDAEICKSQRTWVCLNHRKNLVQTYPEFNVPMIHLHEDQPKSETNETLVIAICCALGLVFGLLFVFGVQ